MITTNDKKTCIKCNKSKYTSEFYQRKTSKDGFRNDCKDCIKFRQKLRYQKPEVKAMIKEYQKSEKYQSYRQQYTATEEYKSLQKIARQAPHRKEYDKNYRLSEKGKESLCKAHAKYCANNPEKRNAKAAIHAEIYNGRLCKTNTLPCVRCRENASEYHHCFGYEPKNWLNVIPLCRQCHINTHKQSP